MILDFQNNGAVVLTTQEPGALLNFRLQKDIDSSIRFIPSLISDISAGMLWVNGLDISQDASIYDDASSGYYLYSTFPDPCIASFFLYTRELKPFDTNLKINYTGYTVKDIENIEDWNDINWTGPAIISGSYISYSNKGYSGEYIESNRFTVTGGNRLDVSMSYSRKDIPGSDIATLIVYQVDSNISTTYSPGSAPGSIFPGFNFSLDLSTGTTGVFMRFYGTPSGASFEVDSINIKESGYFNISVDVSVLNRPYVIGSDSINRFGTSNIQIDGDTSYLVLRTNPKFSGNIKLIADSSNFLYLDTIKVSDILNNKLYRKQKISGNSSLSSDIRKIFSSIPIGEIYKLDTDDTLNIAIPKTDLYKQYNLNYSYGARLFEDDLYDEDYAMFAPIWINNKLPDYFAIFRVPGVMNPETYPKINEKEDLTGLADKFLRDGQLMKSWSIKEGTPIGTYLTNHLNELNHNISPMFLSLSDTNLKSPDPNTWNGIAIDKGIITGRSETTFFFDKNANNFTDSNAFCSRGFERLNLLCPNLINMEYVFNDNDVSLYTMQRYYGLYLTENPLYTIAYYSDSPDGPISILSLDEKDNSEFFNSQIFDIDGSISYNYGNRLFTLNDLLTIRRISNVHQIDGTQRDSVKEWLNKPGENIFSTEIKKVDNVGKFLTFSISNALTAGEHLRIIDNTDNKIWEIFSVNSDILTAGDSWTYATEYSKAGYPTIYRTLFSIKGSIEDQNNAIYKAFNVFSDYPNTPFKILKKKKYGQTLNIEAWAYGHDIKFQRLSAQTSNFVFDTSGTYVPNSPFNSASNYADIKFYGELIPTIDDFERIKYDSSFGPINFELFGDRLSLYVDFFDSSSYNLYSIDSSLSNLFHKNILYISPDSWYRQIQYFDISTNKKNSFQYIEDPLSESDKISLMTTHQIVTVNGIWNAYGVYPLIISLMGINPVKDFDYTVYDSSTADPSVNLVMDFKSDYWYKREGDASTFSLYINADSSVVVDITNTFEIIKGNGNITIGGENILFNIFSPADYFKFNTFDSSAIINATTATTITYAILDGSTTFKSFKSNSSEEYLKDYYLNYNKSTGFYGSKKLKYGLTVPYITKWEGLGNDCRNNPLRLTIDTSILDISTNFIPTINSLSDEIFYPSFKYLTPGDRNWKDYIFFDINDTITYIENGNTYYTTFKEMMLNEPYSDIFSKLMYSNNNAGGTKLRSSITYYNNYKDTIDTILSGLNLSISIDDSAKSILNIKDWDKFRISGIAVPSRNRDNNYPIEVFINENTKTILIVWYQGNDILNYNYRNSSKMMGKGVLDPLSSYIKPIQWRGFDDSSRFFSHIKTPFGVNNATLSSNIFNIYGISNTYDPSICSSLMQSNLNFGDKYFSVFNPYDGNRVIGSGFEFFDKSFDTFRGFVNYLYLKQSATYGESIANHVYSYMNNTNIYINDTCRWNTLNTLLLSNRVKYYIIKNDNIYTSNSFQINPISITINTTRVYNKVATYNGWYKPQFNNILEFAYNEDKNISDIVKQDFTFANTNIRAYNNIPQLWYNKVVRKLTSYDVSIANAIDYIKEWNPFKSQWDSKYYYLYSAGVKTQIDGYNANLEMPSYFGSKLIKLPNSLVLDMWSNTTSYEDQFSDRLSLSFNLSRSIINIFKNNDVFIANWSNLTQSDNIMDEYIKKTILNYYNISKSKIQVEIWAKPYKDALPYKSLSKKSINDRSQKISYTLDSSFTKWTGANINGEISYINNEYIYTVNVRSLPAYIYFVKFILFEK